MKNAINFEGYFIYLSKIDTVTPVIYSGGCGIDEYHFAFYINGIGFRINKYGDNSKVNCEESRQLLIKLITEQNEL